MNDFQSHLTSTCFIFRKNQFSTCNCYLICLKISFLVNIMQTLYNERQREKKWTTLWKPPFEGAVILCIFGKLGRYLCLGHMPMFIFCVFSMVIVLRLSNPKTKQIMNCFFFFSSLLIYNLLKIYVIFDVSPTFHFISQFDRFFLLRRKKATTKTIANIWVLFM